MASYRRTAIIGSLLILSASLTYGLFFFSVMDVGAQMDYCDEPGLKPFSENPFTIPYEEPNINNLEDPQYSPTGLNPAPIPADVTSSISVTTDRIKYLPGDFISISGFNLDYRGCPVHSAISLEVASISSKEVIYNGSVYSFGGIYNDNGLNVNQPGKFQVRTSADDLGNIGYTTFEVVDLFVSRPALIIYIGIAFFVGLMFIISRGIVINPSISEILRFICITGIATTPIMAFALTDVQIGTTAPVGLVKRPPLDEKGEPKWEDAEQTIPKFGGDWIINVGGTWEDYFTRGIQIPVNVFIFGIAGGYLRYLWKTAKLKSNNANVLAGFKGDRAKIRTWLFYQSLEDLALLFLSPLLAIAVWFVLFEGGTTGNYAIAVISFTVGLVTEEVIQALIGFSGSILRRNETEIKQVKNKIKNTYKKKKITPTKL